MFGQINWSRWALLLSIVLTVVITDGTGLGLSQVGPTAPAPNPTGKWKLDTGETIDITQSGSDEVTAKFSPQVRCWDLQRTGLFSGKLKTTGSGATATVTIEDGRFWACTRNERMWKECGVPKIFETKMRNVTVSPFSITGEVLRPGYYLPGGDFRRCRPDSEYEEWVPFSLAPLCRPSTPWFDKGTNCQRKLVPTITVDYTSFSASVQICVHTVFRYSITGFITAPANLEFYGKTLGDRVIQQVGGLVCCDEFENAVRTGRPCNPLLDVDCDGKPNQTDVALEDVGHNLYVPYPEINIFSTPPGASVPPFPEGLNPDDPGFVPNSNGCDCKWQLIKGVLNCGSAGQGHSYVATWKCPTTGREVTTTKNATPNTPCP